MIIAALCGIGAGFVTGVTPGVHVNLVASLLVASVPFVPFDSTSIVVFIIAMATMHTFVDIVPSIFLGAPDSATALGVLPGHRYVLRGNGLMAVKLSTIGALGGLLCGFASFLAFRELTVLFDRISPAVLGWVLLALPLIMWLRDKKKIAAGCIVVFASVYGFLGFRYPDPLFPMLSGMFGAATMLYSFYENTTVPEQQILPYTELRWADVLRALAGGVFAGGLTAVLPGVGAAHAAVFGMLLAIGTGDHGFLVLTGAIGTVNFFLGLAAYDAIGKARSGALLAATTVSPSLSLQTAFGAALFAGGVGVITTLWLGKVACRALNRVPYRLVSVGVLVLVTSLVLLLSGWEGLLLYVTGTAIGLIPAVTKAQRAHAMSCILVPVSLRFLGIG